MGEIGPKKRQWWAYLHESGTVHVRNYHEQTGEKQIREAEASAHADEVFGPFDADDIGTAKAIARKHFGKGRSASGPLPRRRG